MSVLSRVFHWLIGYRGILLSFGLSVFIGQEEKEAALPS